MLVFWPAATLPVNENSGMVFSGMRTEPGASRHPTIIRGYDRDAQSVYRKDNERG